MAEQKSSKKLQASKKHEELQNEHKVEKYKKEPIQEKIEEQKTEESNQDPINDLIKQFGKENAIKRIIKNSKYHQALIPLLMEHLNSHPKTDEKFTPLEKAELDFYQHIYKEIRKEKAAPPKTEEPPVKKSFFNFKSKPKPQEKPNELLTNLIADLENKSQQPKKYPVSLSILYTQLNTVRPTKFKDLNNFKNYTAQFLRDLMHDQMMQDKINQQSKENPAGIHQTIKKMISCFYTAHSDLCNDCKIFFFNHETSITVLLHLLYESKDTIEQRRLLDLIFSTIQAELSATKEKSEQLPSKNLPVAGGESSSSSKPSEDAMKALIRNSAPNEAQRVLAASKNPAAGIVEEITLDQASIKPKNPSFNE